MQADQNLETNSMMPETKQKSEFIPIDGELTERQGRSPMRAEGRNAEVKVGRSGERTRTFVAPFLHGVQEQA